MTDTLTPIEVVYLGRRMTADGKVGYLWITPDRFDALRAENPDNDKFIIALDRQSSLFGKSKAGVIGSVYTAKGKIENDRVVSMTNAVSWTPKKAGDGSLHGELDLIDRANMAEVGRKRAEAKLKSDSAAMREIEFLRGVYHKMPYSNRPAFIAALLSLLQKG